MLCDAGALCAAEGTQHDAGSPSRELLIGQALDKLEFRDWYFCLSDVRAPWGVRLPRDRTAAAHAVLEGECVFQPPGERSFLRLAAGDMVVLPRCDAHSICDQPGRKTEALDAVPGIDRSDRCVTTFTHPGAGARTVLLSASFVSGSQTALSFTEALPSFIILRSGTPASARIEPLLSLVRAEAGQHGGASSAVLRRTSEIMFIQAVREALLDAPSGSGWLAAAADPRLAPVLVAMHERLDHPWTLNELAGLACLSRTAFFERFSALVGQRPIEYLRNRRLEFAAQRLRNTRDDVGAIAMDAGYASPAAFARAFRKVHGQSPQEMRVAWQVRRV